MKYFLYKRLLTFIFLLTAVSHLLFFLPHILPGDPAMRVLGEGSHFEDIQQVRKELNLDKPLLQQYRAFLSHLFNLSLGGSLYSRDAVSGHILAALPNTLLLSLVSMFFAALFSFPPAILAAYKENKSADAWVTLYSSIGSAIPNFLLGPLLIIIFALQLNWLPVSGDHDLSHFILPGLTLGLSMSAFLCRITKNATASELKQPHVLLARAKGLKEFQVFRKHVLKNAMIPIVTTMGMQLGLLLTGTIITETIFSLRGIGLLLITSVNRLDYPMVQGIVLFMTFAYLFTTLLVDMIYVLLDPRIRYETAKK